MPHTDIFTDPHWDIPSVHTDIAPIHQDFSVFFGHTDWTEGGTNTNTPHGDQLTHTDYGGDDGN
jgi:hypothetical protein